MAAHRLNLDLETYSSVSIRDAGAWKYIASPDFEILLLAYSLDGGPVQVIDVASGETVPDWLIKALTDPDYIKSAYNAPFEYGCLDKVYGGMIPSQWRCTMFHGLYCGYTAGLDATGKALGLPEDKQKLSTGKALIRYFCVPCKPTRTNGQRTRNLPKHDPDKWALFKTYNAQDVVTEMEIEKRLSLTPVPDWVQHQWEVDLTINQRGVAVDQELVQGALYMDAITREALMGEATRITELANPNSGSQLLAWLNKALDTGEEDKLTNLRKDTVSKMLEGMDDGDARRVLEIRQELAKTSVKKYDAIEACVCDDNRVRGLLQFYGANRTGRWAGRLVQVQNLPRTYTKNLDLARQLVKDRETGALRTIYGSVPDTLSQLIRTAFVASPGHVLIDADFSAIEARVISWLAGEEWKLEAFRKGRDIYCETASQMFGVPVEKHGVNSELRAKGKIAELACIARGQLVLTDTGLVPIERVTREMRLWDGAEWVTHGGVIAKGKREVITYDGLTATADHIVWAEVAGKYREIRFGDAASSGAHIVKSGSGRETIRLGEDHFTGETLSPGLAGLRGADRMHGLRSSTVDALCKSGTRKIKRLSKLYTEKSGSSLAGSEIHSGKAEMRKSERPGLQKLWRARNPLRVLQRDRGLSVHDSDLRFAGQGDGNRPDQCEWQLRAGKPAMDYPSGQLSESAEVYDILNAGPRNRYTVSDTLVHNCGYQGGVGALINMGALDMGLTEAELPEIVTRWRDANDKIRSLWYDMDGAAIEVIGHGGSIKVRSLVLSREYDTAQGVSKLVITLPSGRCLYYINPSLGTNQFGGSSIVYNGVDQTTKQWKQIETYGGKLTENCVQAIARDALAGAVDRLEAVGLPIVFHVHDEVVIDAKPFGTAKEMLKKVTDIMSAPIPWAATLPLNADGWVGDYFTKD